MPSLLLVPWPAASISRHPASPVNAHRSPYQCPQPLGSRHPASHTKASSLSPISGITACSLQHHSQQPPQSRPSSFLFKALSFSYHDLQPRLYQSLQHIDIVSRLAASRIKANTSYHGLKSSYPVSSHRASCTNTFHLREPCNLWCKKS